MSKAYIEQDIRERSKELGQYGMDSALTIGTLTLSSYASSARAAMLSQHIVQSLIPVNPEVPKVSTGYEKLFGDYSEGYKTIDPNADIKSKCKGTVRIIDKIERYPGYSYILITQDDETGEYGIVERKEVRNLAEIFGFKWNNEVIDSYDIGDVVKKNTVYAKSPSFDEYGNFRYGVNARVAYVISQETIEDAVVISESFAKKISTTYVDTCMVPINDNDIPLNLYGDSSEYKSFPDVGEKTKKGLLCATRKITKVASQYDLKNSNLKKLMSSDDLYQLSEDWIIADIDIWSNKSLDSIPDSPAYRQVKKYLKANIEYYSRIFDVFGKILDDGYACSPQFTALYDKARNYLDPGCKFMDNDRIFGNIEMEFTMYKYVKMRKGCKLAGRCGNKSVVSRVLPDEEIGCTEDGTPIDIRMSALGVIGRLNSAQSIEQELCWVSNEVVRRMKECTDINDKYKILIKYIKMTSAERGKEYEEYWASLSKSEKIKEIKETEEEGIITVESPMYCTTVDQLAELVKEFKPKTQKLYIENEYGQRVATMREMIVGEEYILRLKQEPNTKLSARSKSMMNPRTSMPIKSTQHAKHKKLYPDQANRLGEQEQQILLLSSDNDALDYFLRSHSSSNDGRRSSTLFTDDPNEGFIINLPTRKSRAVEMLNAYLKTMGNAIHMEYEDEDYDPEDDDDPIVAEVDNEKIPKYILKMFNGDDK